MLRSILLDDVFNWTIDGLPAQDDTCFSQSPGLHGYVRSNGEFYVSAVSGGVTPLRRGVRPEDWSAYE